MPTRNVVLTPHHATLIDSLVSSGRYGNASEVVREGLRLVETREAEDAAKLEALRVAADAGIAAMERGEYKEFASPTELVDHLRRLSDSVLSVANPA